MKKAVVGFALLSFASTVLIGCGGSSNSSDDAPKFSTKVELGKQLYSDKNLSRDGNQSCATCHNDGAGYNATFAKAYPHSVAMAKNIFGIESVHLDEMIQICMVQPMATEPLEWSGAQLAALTQYMASVQKQLSENPCALKGSKCGACGPCAGKNPCATKNPCAGKNPCAAKNPCSASNGRLGTDVAP